MKLAGEMKCRYFQTLAVIPTIMRLIFISYASVKIHTRQKWSYMFEDLSCTVRFYYNHKMAAKMADMQSMKQ